MRAKDKKEAYFEFGDFWFNVTLYVRIGAAKQTNGRTKACTS